MINIPSFSTLSVLGLASASWVVSCSPMGAATDFNLVGKEVSRKLQNAHYSRTELKFDENLSQRFLKTYLESLDPGKLYFTQQDVDGFQKKYGSELHEYLLGEKAMVPAKDIFSVLQQRAADRIREARGILKTGDFAFNTDKFVERSREKADWPKDEAEAKAMWKERLEEQVLTENLRRETLAKLASEQGKEDPSAKEKPAAEKISLRYDRVLRALKEMDEEDVADAFLSAVALSYDPHTEYMSARELDKFYSSMSGELTGVGALLQSDDDGATKIAGIVSGGPIDKSGEIQLGDRIVAVDPNASGEMIDIMFMSIDKVVDLVRGKVNVPVVLKVESAASPGKPKLVKLVRQKVEMKDELAKAEIIKARVDGKERRIGYLNLPSFYVDFKGGDRSCARDVLYLLARMKRENVDGLILDLRNNGGGSLDEVCTMGGFFTGKGPVVQIKQTSGAVSVKNSRNAKPVFDGPMIVMTNKLSASASEILAAQLQDYGRAVIVGGDTFGKGTVQQPLDLASSMPYFADKSRAGAIKLTIQKFYRVAGGSTQLDGVKVDIPIPSPLDSVKIAESELKYPMPHDKIDPTNGYSRSGSLDQLLPLLKKQSAERIGKDREFAMIREENAWTEARIKENRISLNKSVREKETGEQEQKRKSFLSERKKSYANLEAADAGKYEFYRLTLDDVKAAQLPKLNPKADKEQYMKMEKDKIDDLELTVDFPSGLDPEKREALNIMEDLLSASQPRIAQEQTTGKTNP